MSAELRASVKTLAGRLPWAPELYQGWLSGKRPPVGGSVLARLDGALPSWSAAAASYGGSSAGRVLVVGYLPWWFEFSVALGVLLQARGNRVDIGFVPYRRWSSSGTPFDARRQSAYLRTVLAQAPHLTPLDLSVPSRLQIPADLEAELERLAVTDVEYTLQREEPDFAQDREAAALWDRRQRNRAAAANTLRRLRQTSYNAVVVPNGSILEFGAVYQAARSLGVSTITYEFGEQRERVWLCRDGEAMRLETADLWQARGGAALTSVERRQIKDLVRARQGGESWAQFGRQWQKSRRRGASDIRQSLGLDAERPVVLIATNVVGDSLALNRQVFTHGMADWLSQTLRHLAARPDVQTVVRIHPGELLGAGMPSERVVHDALPDLPPHVVLIPPSSEVNTYDLIENAHLGLVYTSTAGLEMAMHGVPVVIAGQTHYRGKGFTEDPDTLAAYFACLDDALARPAGHRLPEEQVELAWRYAHRFFFEFPFAFPWHLLTFWKDMEARPLESLVQPGGGAAYREVLDVFSGVPIDWEAHARRP
jgi:hypothetical protein